MYSAAGLDYFTLDFFFLAQKTKHLYCVCVYELKYIYSVLRSRARKG